MGFREEIIKARRKVAPYLRFAQALNPVGDWAGPAERLYSSAEEGTGPLAMKGHVLSFGTFSRAVASTIFSLEIPSLSLSLVDEDLDWRAYANEPYDTLLRKWIYVLLRVHDDDDEIYDATVALGQIQQVTYPPKRLVQIGASVAPPELLGSKIPRRTITLDDWPGAPPESVGKAVPILYGTLSNAVETFEEEEEVGSFCVCEEYLPAPNTPGINDPNNPPPMPGVRWSDHFTYADQGLVENPNGDPTDGWLMQNYHGIIGVQVETGPGPSGADQHLVVCTESGYDELTRGIGVQLLGYPEFEAQESSTTINPKYGAQAGQFGACGMVVKTDSPWNADLPVLMEVWGPSIVSANVGGVMGLLAWDGSIPGTSTDLILYIAGSCHRRNGASPYPLPIADWGGTGTSADLSGPDQGYWQTIAMRNILIPGEWQKLEMKWKIGAYVSETGGVEGGGWVQVMVDDQLVIYLQDVQFSGMVNPGEQHPDYIPVINYWEGVAFRPLGKLACLYVSDRSYCEEALEIAIEAADPCGTNVGSESAAGAVPCILVDADMTEGQTTLARISGIEAPTQNNDEAPEAWGYGYPGGNIPGQTSTWYRVTGVLDGQESSWSSLIECENFYQHFDRIEWDAPPQGADSYRVYQLLTVDLQLHMSDGGVLREETYYVKVVPGTQEPGGRIPNPTAIHWVEFSARREGTAQIAAQYQTAPDTYRTTYVLCGHAVSEVLDVYAPLPGLEEVLGGLNLMTGEKEPITFQDTAARMTRLTPETDYTVQVVEKPSGRFTVIEVYRRMKRLDSCTYAPLTVNVNGIAEYADGSGGLVFQGAKVLEHFLLNWVFNHYETGEWFHDVASSPGLIDKDSFDDAYAYAQGFLEGGYIGAVALLEPAEARQLIMEALTSYNLMMFYKNVVESVTGSWSVAMFDTRWFQAALDTSPQFTPEDDMIADTFQTAISLDLTANVIHYRAGPNYTGSGNNGWIVTGKLDDDGSIARSWGRIERELVMPWTRHGPTASDVAAAQLSLRSLPVILGQFQTMGRGVLIEPGSRIKIEHSDAPGLGWLTRVALIIGNDLDMDTGVVTLRFLTTPSMV